MDFKLIQKTNVITHMAESNGVQYRVIAEHTPDGQLLLTRVIGEDKSGQILDIISNNVNQQTTINHKGTIDTLLMDTIKDLINSLPVLEN